MALLGFDTHENALRDIGWMTLREYQLRMDAWQLRQVFQRQQVAWQAWQNQAVQAVSGSGSSMRPKYRTFGDFFNFEQEMDAVLPPRGGSKKKKKIDEVKARVVRLNEFEALRAAGRIIPWSQRKREGR
ncbi:hypothetical protein [Lacticaseibacillus mingshuiensis]|uniref:hypothetical protein n=1 Tax=Lacticaseibacillus mingshuiensis TaxID=2799574 RepID=UPI001952739B|nr:hypothetical protein [Lacticaseibacillus mingshuiensis]